jgi:septum site-determining protein MinC
MQPKVQIKGIREGLLITLGDGEWSEIRDAFLDQIEKQNDFLRGARLALDVGNRPLSAVELGKLRDTISDKGLVLWAVLSFSPKTIATAQSLGLATRLSKPIPHLAQKLPETRFFDGEEATLVKRTLRSGYSLQFPGHVVVIGDVNPGAQIIAKGDVIVWGRLRGVVHAGAEGDEGSRVCALDLTPTQLRIAGQIAVAPKRRGKPHPEVVRLVDGQVVAEAWNPKHK